VYGNIYYAKIPPDRPECIAFAKTSIMSILFRSCNDDVKEDTFFTFSVEMDTFLLNNMNINFIFAS